MFDSFSNNIYNSFVPFQPASHSKGRFRAENGSNRNQQPFETIIDEACLAFKVDKLFQMLSLDVDGESLHLPL